MITPEERKAIEDTALQLIRKALAGMETDDEGGMAGAEVHWSPRRKDGRRTISSTYAEKKIRGGGHR